MKKIKTALLLIVVVTFISCDYDEKIEIKKGQTGGLYEMNAMGKDFEYQQVGGSMKLDTVTFIPLSDLKEVIRKKQDNESGLYTLDFKLNPEAAKRFGEMTQRNLNRSICLVIKDKIVMAPIVNSPITNGEISLTVGSQDELEEIISLLKY